MAENQFSTVITPSKEKETNANAFTNTAKESKKLLDIVSEVKNVTSAHTRTTGAVYLKIRPICRSICKTSICRSICRRINLQIDLQKINLQINLQKIDLHKIDL